MVNIFNFVLYLSFTYQLKNLSMCSFETLQRALYYYYYSSTVGTGYVENFGINLQ